MVIANQYHLLLEALSALGIKLQLQLSKAALILSSVTLPILSQNFSLEMDMEGVRQLSVLRLLRLTPEGWQELPNSCGMLLSSREVYHEEAYRKMLLLARSELLGNMRMMLEDKRFDICSVDLSGGLDSRMVYGMLTNFPEYREHACIISRDVPGSRDLQIASSINTIYGYPYYALPVHFYRIPVKKMDQLFRSVKLGTYYCGNPAWDYREPNRELNLSGACGEIVSRPYFARNYFDMPKPDPSLSELLQFVATKSSPYVMVDGKVFQLFQKLFMKEIAEIPGSSAFEKFDKHYLLFRNSYHFGDNRYDALIDRNGAIPLLSKWMFRLHHMSFDAFRSIKLQLDMIYQLNRELAFIPYDDERDNRDFDRLAPQLYMPEGCLPKRQLCDMPNDLDSWKCAQQESRQATRRDTSQLNQLQLEEYRHLPQMVLNSLFYNFYLLMRRFPALQEQVGPAVYHYILQNQSDSKKIRSLYNRVTSLLDQVRIFDRCQADGQ